MKLLITAALLMLAVASGCTTYDLMTPEQLDDASLHELQKEWRQVCWFGTSGLTRMREWSSEPAYKAAIVSHAIPMLNLSDEEVQQIRGCEIRQGSTSDVVYWVWGPPHDKRVSHTPYGTTETWYYHPGAADGGASVTFNNGEVTWWHVEE